jgi:hypothetical protein
MAYDVQTGQVSTAVTGQESSMTSLVSGIIDDFQRLMHQQLALFRREVQDDMNKTLEAASLLAVGAVVALVGLIVLSFAAAWGLVYAFPQTLHIAGALGIVGAVLAIGAGIMMYLGTKMFESFNPLPDESAQALKENVQCLTTTMSK